MNIGIADEKEGLNIGDTFQIFAENVLNPETAYRLWANEMVNEAGDREQEEKYDILIINDLCCEKIIEAGVNNLGRDSLLILNGDSPCEMNIELKNPIPFITYGFSSKASITASSVIEDEYKIIQCCIQREIKDFFGNPIEPQEFSVSIYHKNKEVYHVLAAVTALLILGADIKKLDMMVHG